MQKGSGDHSNDTDELYSEAETRHEEPQDTSVQTLMNEMVGTVRPNNHETTRKDEHTAKVPSSNAGATPPRNKACSRPTTLPSRPWEFRSTPCSTTTRRRRESH
jgi:hypothetical protein